MRSGPGGPEPARGRPGGPRKLAFDSVGPRRLGKTHDIDVRFSASFSSLRLVFSQVASCLNGNRESKNASTFTRCEGGRHIHRRSVAKLSFCLSSRREASKLIVQPHSFVKFTEVPTRGSRLACGLCVQANILLRGSDTGLTSTRCIL